jgi:hypothetical protein
MSLQHDNQLLVHSAQTLRLLASPLELPKRDSVSHQHGQDNEAKTESQAGTDVEPMERRSFLAGLFRPFSQFRHHTGLLLLTQNYSQKRMSSIIRDLPGHAP